MQIFISYSRKDIDLVQRIVVELANNNIDTWIDWKSIPKGEDWLQEIYHGIEKADAFLFLISPDSIQSQMCRKELAHAVENSKRIVPLVCRDINPSEAPTELLGYNWLFARPDKEDLQKSIIELVRVINVDLDYIRRHTNLQIKALEWERRSRDHSYLLRGIELQETEMLINKSILKDPKPTSLQLSYVLASRNHIQVQRRRIVIGGASIAVMALCAGGFLAYTLLDVNPISIEWVQLSTGLIIGIAIGALSFWIPTFVSKFSLESKVDTHKLTAEEADYLEPDTIFISYSNKDWEKYVKPLIDFLRQNEFKIWIDQRKLHGGDNWLEEIDNALSVCERMVLCVSPDALRSKYVKKEYRSFIDSEKKLIPVICKTTKLPFELRDIQYLSYDEKELLITALKEYGKDQR
jgi:hypothetical protein